jgi:hypothetical protein
MAKESGKYLGTRILVNVSFERSLFFLVVKGPSADATDAPQP